MRSSPLDTFRPCMAPDTVSNMRGTMGRDLMDEKADEKKQASVSISRVHTHRGRLHLCKLCSDGRVQKAIKIRAAGDEMVYESM